MKTNDLRLLKALYKIHARSGKEDKMRAFVKKECEKRGAVCTNDKHGNLFAVKGKAETYPCICSHLDQVQWNHSNDFTVMRCGDVLFGYSPSRKKQEGLGADDKNGIWIALMMLERLDAVKCAFFVGEETGCVGSSKADLQWFADCRFLIQPDRRNGKDLINSITSAICSKKFLKDIKYKDYGYKLTEGLSTDVGTLSHRGVGLACINVSCGYYAPHTDEESTSVSELEHTLGFVQHICEDCKDVYKHTYKAPVYTTIRSNNTYGLYGSYGSYNSYGSYYGKDGWSWGDKRENKTITDLRFDSDCRTIRSYIRSSADPSFEKMTRSTNDWGYPIFFYEKDMDMLRLMYEDIENELRDEPKLKSALPF